MISFTDCQQQRSFDIRTKKYLNAEIRRLDRLINDKKWQLGNVKVKWESSVKGFKAFLGFKLKEKPQRILPSNFEVGGYFGLPWSFAICKCLAARPVPSTFHFLWSKPAVRLKLRKLHFIRSLAKVHSSALRVTLRVI